LDTIGEIKMLTITYDSINGKVISDGLIKDWADTVVRAYKEVVNMNIAVGSSVMIDATRVLVIKGKLDYKETVYRFKGLDLKVNKHGRLPVWPEGFCDVYDNILEELLGLDDNIIKE
jgi:hypothetical protein